MLLLLKSANTTNQHLIEILPAGAERIRFSPFNFILFNSFFPSNFNSIKKHYARKTTSSCAMTDIGTRNKSVQLSIQHFCLDQFYTYVILVNSPIQHNLLNFSLQT